MPSPPEGHGLGPHVVGLRVVVRRVLPGETGPSGGPAMTDVLGTCLSWGDGVCVVAPDGPGAADRAPVEIRIADIVSGKPVPPRPSARLRIEPRAAQVRALALWPDLETEVLGDWVLRRSPTATARRANSVLAFGPSGVAGGDDAAYARVVAFYDRPIAAVLPDSAEDALFRGHGWVAESNDDDTLFQLAGVATVRRALRSRPQAAPVDVELVGTHPGVVEARLGDLASGIAAYDEDWVGFRSIEVRPEARRRRLGLAVMDALLDWGAEQGATTAYLQVLADNAPARALYAGLGFTTHHAYRYLAPPGR
ncbi:GNAT family N-acetyltransferase [Nocardioides taihuensis]|uniref:GNAT family N-acetyltransferase n=1 Tax=Nocardioides taihuensis TaxID=1835606 RepID=A0ABW0BKE5_9ACTN